MVPILAGKSIHNFALLGVPQVGGGIGPLRLVDS